MVFFHTVRCKDLALRFVVDHHVIIPEENIRIIHIKIVAAHLCCRSIVHIHAVLGLRLVRKEYQSYIFITVENRLDLVVI